MTRICRSWWDRNLKFSVASGPSWRSGMCWPSTNHGAFSRCAFIEIRQMPRVSIPGSEGIASKSRLFIFTLIKWRSMRAIDDQVGFLWCAWTWIQVVVECSALLFLRHATRPIGHWQRLLVLVERSASHWYIHPGHGIPGWCERCFSTNFLLDVQRPPQMDQAGFLQVGTSQQPIQLQHFIVILTFFKTNETVQSLWKNCAKCVKNNEKEDLLQKQNVNLRSLESCREQSQKVCSSRSLTAITITYTTSTHDSW